MPSRTIPGCPSAIITAIALAATLAACGGGGDSTATASTPTDTTSGSSNAGSTSGSGSTSSSGDSGSSGSTSSSGGTSSSGDSGSSGSTSSSGGTSSLGDSGSSGGSSSGCTGALAGQAVSASTLTVRASTSGQTVLQVRVNGRIVGQKALSTSVQDLVFPLGDATTTGDAAVAAVTQGSRWTRDTVSGLDWLDPSLTKLRDAVAVDAPVSTYTSNLSQHPAWVGLRPATVAEVLALHQHAGSTLPYGSSSTVGLESTAQPTLALLNLLTDGVASTSGGGYGGSGSTSQTTQALSALVQDDAGAWVVGEASWNTRSHADSASKTTTSTWWTDWTTRQADPTERTFQTTVDSPRGILLVRPAAPVAAPAAVDRIDLVIANSVDATDAFVQAKVESVQLDAAAAVAATAAVVGQGAGAAAFDGANTTPSTGTLKAMEAMRFARSCTASAG